MDYIEGQRKLFVGTNKATTKDGSGGAVILRIDISALLDMNNINMDDGISSIKKGYMGATGEDFIGERDDEDDMSGSEYQNSPSPSPNPKAGSEL